MKITLICVGRLKDDAERQIVTRYTERFQQMGAGLGFTMSPVVELVESRAATASARKAAEAAEIRNKIAGARCSSDRAEKAGAPFIALDEHGRSLTSIEFAKTLAAWRDDGLRDLYLIIGGPDGLDPAFVHEARLTLSLGKLTLPHGLARAVLTEQLYRAVTILADHPYHRE